MRLFVSILCCAFIVSIATTETTTAVDNDTGSQKKADEKPETAEAKQLTVNGNEGLNNPFNPRFRQQSYNGGNYGSGYDVNGNPNYNVGLYGAGPSADYEPNRGGIYDTLNQYDTTYDPRYNGYSTNDGSYSSQDPRYYNTRYDTYDNRYDTYDNRYDTYDSRYNRNNPRYDNLYNTRYDNRYDNYNNRYNSYNPRYDRYDNQYDNRYDNPYDSRYDNRYNSYNPSLGIRYDRYPTYYERVYSLASSSNNNRDRQNTQRLNPSSEALVK